MNLTSLIVALIDLVRGTKVLATYRELKKLQFSTADEAAERNRIALDSYVQFLKKKQPPLKLTNFSDLPVLDKKAIKLNKDALVNRKARRILLRRTGGSTGEPFEYFTTPLAQSYLWAGMFLSWSVAGYKLGDKVVFLGGGSILGKKNILKSVFFRLHNISIIDCFEFKHDLANRVIAEIERTRPKYIYGYGNVLFEVSKVLKEQGRQINVGIEGIISTADPLSESMRSSIESAFKCPVFSQYGSNDAGVSAFECEHKNGFHLITDRCYLEVDCDGEFIATDMQNRAMAMARYKFGDMGTLSWEPCSCGRGYPRIVELKGRSNDVIKLSQGGIVHSTFFSHFLKSEPGVEQWQVVKINDVITLNIIGLPSEMWPEFIGKYKKKIIDDLDYSSVEIVFDEEVVRTQAGKFRFVIDYDKS